MRGVCRDEGLRAFILLSRRFANLARMVGSGGVVQSPRAVEIHLWDYRHWRACCLVAVFSWFVRTDHRVMYRQRVDGFSRFNWTNQLNRRSRRLGKISMTMQAHKWRPLKGLNLQSTNVDFREIDSLQQQWLNFRTDREELDPDAYKGFFERVYRRWAIETGIIEGIYDIDRGTTLTLVEKGLSADLIERGSTDRDPQDLIKVLRDHHESAEFVTESIRRQTPLSKLYIRELHQLLLRNQEFYIAYDRFGKQIETPLDRGGFKTQPNNPTRPDGIIHEYCPYIQVDSELDKLVDLYRRYEANGRRYHSLLVAAWTHHRFAQIHPFQDGNGRVARALLTWHLAKREYLPVVVSRDDRAQYIESLERADGGDLDPLVEFIVRLEREMILEALGEPAPDTGSRIVSQVLGHITDQVRRRRVIETERKRSANVVAASLQTAAVEYLESQGCEISQSLNEAGLAVERTIDLGGPGERAHWYHHQVVRTAREARHWANLNEDRFFIKLAINPEDQSQTPRLIFVVSLHHVGRQLTGIMAATAFAQIVSSRLATSDDNEEPNDPDFINCTIDAFTFTANVDADYITRRFVAWMEGPLSVALRHWSDFIS